MTSLITPARAAQLLGHLKKAKIADEKGLRKVLDDLGRKFAKEAVDKGTSNGLEALLEGLGGFFGDSGAVDVLDDIFS